MKEQNTPFKIISISIDLALPGFVQRFNSREKKDEWALCLASAISTFVDKNQRSLFFSLSGSVRREYAPVAFSRVLCFLLLRTKVENILNGEK